MSDQQKDLFNAWMPHTDGEEREPGERVRLFILGYLMHGRVDTVSGNSLEIRVTDHKGGFYDSGDLVRCSADRVQVWR